MTTYDTKADFDSDMQALGARTTRALPSRDETARALEGALATRARSVGRRRARRTIFAGAFAVAAAAAVLIVPVPYRHQAGWEATLRSPDGHVAKVRVAARNAGEAQRRAGALARSAGAAEVTLSPRTELVWGSVYAMAKEKLFHVNVDMAGKTDAEVEAEIRAQIAEQGWAPGAVEVARHDGASTVSVAATDGDHQIALERTENGAGAEHVELSPVPIDDTREPGMTDDELRQKILRQLEARGLKAEVTVVGERVQIRATEGDDAPAH